MKPLQINLVLLLLSTLVATCTVAAEEGRQDGSGGGVMKCVKPEDKPVFIQQLIKGRRVFSRLASPTALSRNRPYEFLDLWEAEVGYGPFFDHVRTLPIDPKATKEYWVTRALGRLTAVDPELARQAEKYLPRIRARMIPIPPVAEIMPPQDTSIRFLPKGCAVQGLGMYSDHEDNLVYDASIYSQLPPIDLAAFDLHESIYKYLRDSAGARSSWQTRRIIGLMFSNEPFTKAMLADDFKW